MAAVNMPKLNCEMFQISIQFDETEFHVDSYKKAINCKDKEHNFFVSHHVAKNKKAHSHLEIGFDGDESELKAVFHSGEFEGDDEAVSAVPLEDALPWMATFFEKAEQEVAITAIFRFDNTFTPILQLRYPLLVEGLTLKNPLISGHEIEFSDDTMTGRFIMSESHSGRITAVFSGVQSIQVDQYAVAKEIQAVGDRVKQMMKKRRKDDDG